MPRQILVSPSGRDGHGGAEFLQTPDGKLYCRVGVEGVYQPRGEVQAGDQIAISNQSRVTLLKHIPHARKEGVFTPVELASGEQSEADAAALVELKTTDWSEQFWLRRNDAQLGVRTIGLPAGPVMVLFGYEAAPLGFALKLVDVRRDGDPHSADVASGVSEVELFDDVSGTTVPVSSVLQEISADRPLRHRAVTVHQFGFRELPNQMELSVLRVTSDPGRLLKYLGSGLVCSGILYLACLWLSNRRGSLKMGGC